MSGDRTIDRLVPRDPNGNARLELGEWIYTCVECGSRFRCWRSPWPRGRLCSLCTWAAFTRQRAQQTGG